MKEMKGPTVKPANRLEVNSTQKNNSPDEQMKSHRFRAGGTPSTMKLAELFGATKMVIGFDSSSLICL